MFVCFEIIILKDGEWNRSFLYETPEKTYYLISSNKQNAETT